MKLLFTLFVFIVVTQLILFSHIFDWIRFDWINKTATGYTDVKFEVMKAKRSSKKKTFMFHVDPFIGTDGVGHTTPGAKYPFGLVYLAPVSQEGNRWELTSGYHYSIRESYGIAHTSVSGTGIQFGLDFVIRTSIHPMPIIYEKAELGYYKVKTAKATSEVVAGNRYGIHKYEFMYDARLYFVDKVELHHNDERCIISLHKEVSTAMISYNIYFYAESPVPCIQSNKHEIQFKTANVELHVALSYVDIAGAKQNFISEFTTFDLLKKQTQRTWNRNLYSAYKRLNARPIENDTIMNTALYHMMISPYTHHDVDKRFVGPDKKVHTTSSVYYSFLSTWDIYRTWGPLMCIIMPDVMKGVAETSLIHFKITKTFPRWTFAGQETNIMPGMHSITLTYQAVEFDIVSSKQKYEIYDAFVQTLNASSTFSTTRRVNYELKKLQENGGILYEHEGDTQTISQMLEYAIIFECVAKMAKMFHDSYNYDKFSKSAKVYTRLYDINHKMYTGFLRNGQRVIDKNPYHASNTHMFTEGSATQWIFHVMHDLNGLISTIGKALTQEYLHTIFTKQGTSEVPDTTGLIGMYAHGNEPSHHIAFIFFLLGDISNGTYYVQKILEMYTNHRDGLCGNDDAGQMSAWYVAAKLGMYPVNPTSKRFLYF
jgi:predicted alpha-1,2-mannosidase